MKSGKKSVYEEFPRANSLFSALSKKIADNPFFEFWREFEETEAIAKNIKKSLILGKVEKNVVIDGILVLGKNSLIKAGARIEGKVFIGENSVIGPNAYLRGNVFIHDNCHIANSEIKNSIILSKSNIPHFSYDGDSIIGEKVNLGAGTKIANLRFDNENVKVELNGEKADSGRRKLGCLIGHGTKTGINSSINCGIIVGNSCFIHPGNVVCNNLGNREILQ